MWHIVCGTGFSYKYYKLFEMIRSKSVMMSLNPSSQSNVYNVQCLWLDHEINEKKIPGNKMNNG